MAKIPDVTAFGQRQGTQRSTVVPMNLGREAAAKTESARVRGQTGQAISSFGLQMMDVAQKVQEREDRIRSAEAKSQFTQRMINFESSLQGDKDYKTYGSRFYGEMEKAKTEALGGVKGENFKRLLEADLDLDITQGLDRMARKSWASEVDYGNSSMGTDLVNYREQLLNATDPNLRESILNKMKERILVNVSNGYISEEQGSKLYRGAALDAAEAFVKMQPADQQIKILKSDEGIAKLIPSDRRKELLDKVDTRGISQQKADSIWSDGKDEEAMLKEARDIKEAEIRDEVVSRIKTRISEKKALDAQAQDEAYKSSMALVVKSNSLDAIPPKTWEVMNGVQQAHVRDYVEARANKLANGRKNDDWDVLDEVENKISTGEINDTSDLAPYEPYLKDATIKTKRKEIQKRDVVKSTDMQKAFELRVNKSKAKWSNAQRKEFIAFQDWVLDKVKETGRPEDLDNLADRWVMEGRGLEDAWYSNDPNTFGEAITKGRSDFVIGVPESDSDMVNQTLSVLQTNGAQIPKDKRDVFYTNTYLDGSRFMEVNEYPETPLSMAAYAVLKAQGVKITIDRIRQTEAALSE